ncbi:hypothetical protein MD484_g8802, partial [Candolleomyces efflorescens]
MPISRDDLISSDAFMYVGTPNLEDHLRWHTFGNIERLCVKPAEKSSHKRNDPAHLAIITTFSSTNFFLASDGHWRRSMGYPFAEIRPSALGTAPEDLTFAKDFESFYEYVHAQIKSKSKLALPCIKGIMNMAEAENEDNPHYLKFNHGHLFVRRDNTATKADIKFMEKWPIPASNEDATIAFAEMKDKYLVNPIPAYLDDDLIPPHKYDSELCGATAMVVFTLSRLPKSDQDTFYADIVNIDIIEPGSGDNIFVSPTASKRPAPPMLNPFAIKKKDSDHPPARKKHHAES